MLVEWAGEKGNSAENLLALAEGAKEEQNRAKSESLANHALDEFRGEKLREDEVLARVAFARSFLAQGKPWESQKQIEIAAVLATRSQVLQGETGQDRPWPKTTCCPRERA